MKSSHLASLTTLLNLYFGSVNLAVSPLPTASSFSCEPAVSNLGVRTSKGVTREMSGDEIINNIVKHHLYYTSKK